MSSRNGVLVLGLHRSGTSVTSNVLHRLGLRTPPPADLMPATADNPTGYWESESLAAFNDVVLCLKGGSWSAIPSLDAGWADGVSSRWLRASAARAFDRVFGHEPGWFWKDPRATALLALWRPVLRPAATVIVWRDAAEVAESLRRRDGFSTEVGLAIWERTTLAMLRDAQGMRAIVGRYEDLLEDPAGWTSACADFLIDASVRVPNPPAEAAAVVDGRLRRSSETTDIAGAPAAQAAAVEHLQQTLASLGGPHDELTVGPLPPESAVTGEIMAQRCGRGLRRSIAAPAARAVLRGNRSGRLDDLTRRLAEASTRRTLAGGMA